MAFPYLSMVLDPLGKDLELISNNIKTFVCDVSDNGVAWFGHVTNCLDCNLQLCSYFEYLNDKFAILFDH